LATKAAISTTGHNIANANTEGYSRQRVITEASDPTGGFYGHNTIGTGTRVSRVERVNDEYVEKQIRNAQRDLSFFEEKDLSLRQIEDVFNEMGGDGLNRLVSKFFNQFRELANEPENPSIRQALREATVSMVNDFHRIRQELEEIRHHVDSRIEGYMKEANSLATEVAQLNDKIQALEVVHGPSNDFLDKRDIALKRLSSLLDVTITTDNHNKCNIDIKNVGPFITGGEVQQMTAERTPADGEGKPEQAFDIKTSGSAYGVITHQIKGGKLGALLEVRDKTMSTALSRLDEMALTLTDSVNEVHQKGYGLNKENHVNFFKPLAQKERAAEFMALSDEVQADVDNIAAAMSPHAPADNRNAIAISRLQKEKIMSDGLATPDEWYDTIVSDIGVVTSQNRFAVNQQKDIVTQLNKVRDQISGVSIDEETANLLQFQHVFDASAKVIQVADELMKTVLSLKRD
jgi:flagellar hook-associated protein 1 FlgK